ncbi:MAG: 30S ribosomal protein S1 [Omnitrophica bacterium RIFCSPHIGHO2_02_FULL_46_11]|nr:MAG: 30S ribosomal protein S1 [Omnitrophica bacterium RIFCSPHIGHO2_02_FULL_46_11]OGW87266.1 MAG: 30S ribosomal protein S1 [Omnitrophica bacterium RIFCSPLOWO2_01_FULL_45_10b]
MKSNEANELSTSFAELYEQTFKSVKEGQIVKGKVITILRREAIIDIGYKSEGILPLQELDDPSATKVGDEIEVLFEGLDEESGMAVLSKRKAERQKCWDDLVANANEGSVMEGRIFKKVRGGFMVDIGMEAFLPASLVDLKPVKNLDQYVGQVFPFVIVKINHKRKNIVVSRKDYLEREKEATRSRMVKQLAVGQVVKGRVKNITDFGAFIELGGIDGLLHITDLSWGRVNHPSEVLNLGDELDVMVIAIDKDNEKVSLGLKQITKSPWENVAQKYTAGTKVKGKVTNIVAYGAFVELEPGIEGLIHISELSWTKRVAHPSELLSVGSEVEAVILNVDKEARKISLGLKQMGASPWDNLGDRYHTGDVIEGKIRNITDYGIFVELEPGIDGLIHVSDLSWLKKVSHPSEAVKKGETVRAKVLSLDPQNRKISLGIKQLTEDPWPRLTQSLISGASVRGRITKIVNFGIFVELDNGLEGLVHISEMPHEQAEMLESSFRIGDQLHVYVLHVDNENRKIALSLKGASNSY